jgi:hypothetical protein
MTYAKARTVLPRRKAVHYLQIESKLRALVRFKQAAAVPVAKGQSTQDSGVPACAAGARDRLRPPRLAQ